jgi:hypothetical protein
MQQAAIKGKSSRLHHYAWQWRSFGRNWPPMMTAERTTHTGQKGVIDFRLELRLKETNGLWVNKHSCNEL